MKSVSGVSALLAVFLSACVMGGGSDQPNRMSETVSGTVIGRDGIPQAAARVRLYSGDYRTGMDIGILPSAATLDTEVVTDNRGKYALARFSGRRFLEARSSDSALIAIRPDPILDTAIPVLADIPLAEAASLHGIVVSSARVVALHLAGTHFRCVPDSAGRFGFPILPPGAFRLVAKMGPEHDGQSVSVTGVDLEPGQRRNLDSVFADPDRIPLFDFDSPDPVSALKGLSFAYPRTDSSRVGAWAPRPLKVESTGAYRKRSLHVILKSGSLTGFALGEGYYDLGKMQAFAFRAKGAGKLEVQFHSEMVVNKDPTLRADLTLGSEWREYRITPADIYVPDAPAAAGKGYSWEAAKSAIAKITFLASGGDVDLWLDEVRLEGMAYPDLGPARPAGSDAYP